MSELDSRSELENEFWNLRFGLKRSYFYHEKRVLFWRTALFIAHGTEMALTSTAAAFLFNENSKTFSQWAVLISAILSFIVVWFGADKRIQTNMQKKARFVDLEDRIPLKKDAYSEDVLADLKRARRKIERDDDVVLPCVDALARNDACRALGVPEDRRLNLFERTIGRIFPIPYSKKVVGADSGVKA